MLIEQAKGVLMASEKVDAQTAFTRLRRQARNTRRPVPEVAREIIDGVWGSPELSPTSKARPRQSVRQGALTASDPSEALGRGLCRPRTVAPGSVFNLGPHPYQAYLRDAFKQLER